MQNNMMHIGFRKDFSKKRRVLVEGAWGGVRERGNECKKLTCKHLRYAANNLHDLLSPPLSHSPIPQICERAKGTGYREVNTKPQTIACTLSHVVFCQFSQSHSPLCSFAHQPNMAQSECHQTCLICRAASHVLKENTHATGHKSTYQNHLKH